VRRKGTCVYDLHPSHFFVVLSCNQITTCNCSLRINKKNLHVYIPDIDQFVQMIRYAFTQVRRELFRYRIDELDFCRQMSLNVSSFYFGGLCSTYDR
jgi:hypothetical protein